MIPSDFLDFKLFNQNFIGSSHLSHAATCPAYLMLLELMVVTKLGGEYALQSSSSRIFLCTTAKLICSELSSGFFLVKQHQPSNREKRRNRFFIYPPGPHKS